jgi:flavin-binding protein dodecin
MSDNVYKKIEIVGTSGTSLEDAIQSAVTKAAQTVRRMAWFEVEEIRGAIKEDQVSQWQVAVKIGFTLED